MKKFSLFILLKICLCTVGVQAQAPQNFEVTAFERHIELTWQPVGGATGYEIWRSDDGGSNFTLHKTIPNGIQQFDLDWTGEAGIGKTYFYKIKTLATAADFSQTRTATPQNMTDEQLMEMVQRATFRFFWEHAHPVSGMARERTGSGNTVTTGGTGFGIMAMVVAAERGWRTRAEIVDRMLRLVSFLQIADRFHGVFPHWMNGSTGKTIPFSQFDDGADLVETAFLIQGLLAARQYFSENTPRETALRQAITQIWEDVEWDFFRKNGSPQLYWHWSPNYGWQMNFALRGFNETHLCYILAAASPTHPVPGSLYTSGWASTGYVNGGTYYGYPIFCGPSGGGPMFFAHYSYLGFDPRHRKDQFCNYFTRNRNHALIQQAYCISNPENHKGYSAECWGLTASDNPWGYYAHDIVLSNDNGTIAPTAALASMPYTPAESMAALRHFYRVLGKRLWSEQGFYDAFNLDQNWFATSHLAIDQGPIIVMIENHRTGLLWDMFMKNPEIQPALDAIGFVPDVIGIHELLKNEAPFSLIPNPVRAGDALKISTSDAFSTADEERVRRITFVNATGSVCQQFHFSSGKTPPLEVPTNGLAAGFYFLKIETSDGKMQVSRVVLH